MLPTRPPRLDPPSQRHHDAIVVGAGYVGLAAARRIAELRPDHSVLLLDADEIGEGSSGRNAGFAVSVPFNAGLSEAPLSPAERLQLDLYERGLADLDSLVRRHRIDCGWNPSPKLHAAATADGERRLKAALRSYAKWQIDYEECDRSQIRQATGSDHYRYGFRTGRNVFIQPAALVRGLADSLPPNVHLCESTPVLDVQAQATAQDKPVVATSAGRFSADRLILANNAFVKRLGYLRDRLVTIYTYAALTPDLSPAERSLAGQDDRSPLEWGILPANRLGTTVRLVTGRRLLFRSAYSYERELPVARVEQLLLASYRRRFPQMPKHEFEFVWGGTTALTSNGEASFGTVAPGIYCFAGCNGSGIVKGSVYGRMLAELSLGLASPQLDGALDRPEPGYLPPEPFRTIGARAAIAYQAWKAGAER
jgi:glycine/D-amino acid oxidase-like deaminating enzyme